MERLKPDVRLVRVGTPASNGLLYPYYTEIIHNQASTTTRVFDNHSIGHTEVSNDDDPHHTSLFNQASRFVPPRSCQICLFGLDKFGDDARDQTGGLIESSTRLKFFIIHPALHNPL